MSYHGGLDGPDLRQWDRRAILTGGVVQTLGIIVVVLSGLPTGLNLLAIVLGALAATATSRSYGREYADAAAGATVGVVIAFVVLVTVTYVGTAGMDPVARGDTLFTTVVFGTGQMLAGGMIATIVAVLVGFVFGGVFRE